MDIWPMRLYSVLSRVEKIDLVRYLQAGRIALLQQSKEKKIRLSRKTSKRLKFKSSELETLFYGLDESTRKFILKG
jgi:hypothetical protein